MMYWLTDTGRAPTGQLPGEDCIPFDPANLAVVEIGGRWKVVEGTHWLLDFGPGKAMSITSFKSSRREENGFVLTVQDADRSEVLERHGIVGLVSTRVLQVDLPGPAGVVDVGIAHFRTPPVLLAYSQDEQVAAAEADDRGSVTSRTSDSSPTASIGS